MASYTFSDNEDFEPVEQEKASKKKPKTSYGMKIASGDLETIIGYIERDINRIEWLSGLFNQGEEPTSEGYKDIGGVIAENKNLIKQLRKMIDEANPND